MPPPDGRLRVQVHPGAGLVARHDDLVLVVPELPVAPAERVAELLRVCRRPDPGGAARMDALRALLDLPSAAELPRFAALGHDGHALRVLVHGPVRVLVDGRVEVGTGGDGDRLPAERTLADGAWRAVSVVAGGVAGGVAGTDAVTGGVADSLPLDLEAGVV